MFRKKLAVQRAPCRPRAVSHATRAAPSAAAVVVAITPEEEEARGRRRKEEDLEEFL